MIRNWMAALTLGLSAALPADERVDSILARAEKGSAAAAFDAARELVELGSTVRGALQQRLADSGPTARLALARALIELDEVDRARDALVELAAAEAPAETRRTAVQMLGITDFAGDEVVVKLLRDRLDQELDPLAKVALAKSLYRVSASDQLRCTKELERALDSDRSQVRTQAALALAEVGSIELARPILLRLQGDPTPEGRLAVAYLEKEKMARLTESAARNPRPRAGDPRQYAPDADFDLLQEVLDRLLERHVQGREWRTPELREELLEAAANGMMQRLDPHSNFFTQEEHERWNLDLRRDYGGIGAYVDQVGEEKVFTITRPIYSGPAYEAGLRSRDQILKVDGWETTGEKDINEIIRRLKGPAGTPVTITVYRRGWTDTKDYTLERQRILIPSVVHDLLPGDLGYVELVTFGSESFVEMVDALNDLKARGMKALILDLRNNTGGFLEVATLLVGLFCGEGKLVVSTKGPMPMDNQVYETPQMPVEFADPQRLPMAVLINDVSASASEILSGCLKHYGRAALVGTHTYGKGSVQTPMSPRTRQEEFDDKNGNREYDPGEPFVDRNGNGKWDLGPYMKITTGRYYLPDGSTPDRQYDTDGRVLTQEIDGKRYILGGVHPDLVVELAEPDLWKEQEFARLLAKSVDRRRATPFHAYLDQHYEKERERFLSLASGDRRDWRLYPGFEEFYAGLDTRLGKDDVRYYLRHYLRERVCDDRKQTFPLQGYFVLGDYQEDNQLQAAIRHVLDKLGRKPADFAQYDSFGAKVVDADGRRRDGPSSDGGN